MDHCFSDQPEVLVEHAKAMLQIGRSIRTEVITMPRRGFGPRPVTMSSAVTRTVYSALVDYLSKAAGMVVRGEDHWKRHESFGVPNKADESEYYLVDVDIASCYEYIEHETLAREIAMRAPDVDVIEGLASLLSELMGRPRGLPQLSTKSDLLADVYLQKLERTIARSGYKVSRIADDFKVIAHTWTGANQVIEKAAEQARRLGLVLSTEKTTIRKSSTVLGASQEEANFLNEHFDMASEGIMDLVWNPYGDSDVVEVDPDEEEVLQEAFWLIVEEWFANSTQETALHVAQLSPALSVLKDHEDRITDEILKEIVFRYPIRLDSVCRYLIGRKREVSANWDTLSMLAGMGRQSAWAKLWILHTAAQLSEPQSWDSVWVADWAERQLLDRHEVVRAEAAWTLAGMQNINGARLASLFGSASKMTRPAIVAAAGRAGLKANTQVVGAMIGDSRLMRPAYDWGVKKH
jgi:hypothetical protein